MKAKEEMNALKNEAELSAEELAQVNAGKTPWDTSIQDETVPVKNGDYCPRRCGNRVQIAYGYGGEPLYLICTTCEYTYTPADGQFY